MLTLPSNELPEGPGLLEMIGVLVAMAVVLAAAYYVTLIIGGRAGKMNSRTRLIKPLDTFTFSKDKSVSLVNINGKTYFLGIANNGITVLDKVDLPEELVEQIIAEANTPIASVIKRSSGFFKKKAAKSPGGKESRPPSGKNFADFIDEAREETAQPQDALDELTQKLQNRGSMSKGEYADFIKNVQRIAAQENGQDSDPADKT